MNDDKAEKIALFRYGLIAPLVLETLPRGELTRRAQEIAALRPLRRPRRWAQRAIRSTSLSATSSMAAKVGPR
jgi:hypothetical protein